MNVKQIKSTQTGFVLLTSVFIVLFLTLILGAAFMKSDMQLREATQKRSVMEAFYTAEAGIDRALFELRRNPDWKPGQNGEPAILDERLNTIIGDDTTTIGFMSVDVEDGGFLQNLGETRWVRSIGRDVLTDLPRIIVTRVLIDDPSRFLLSTPGALRFKSGAQIDADVLGKDLFFDINASLPAAERMIDVNGDVLYINELNPADPAADPDINITGIVGKYPSITFPGVDVSRYSGLAISHSPLEGHYVDGDLNIDLENLDLLNGDPGFAPAIIFATGDIRVSGEYANSVLVVAGGDIYIEGDIVADTSINGGSANVGLFAKQDLVIEDGVIAAGADLNLEAFIIADGGGDSKGIFKAESTAGLGTFNFKGAISVRGEGGDSTGIDLSIFANRNYTHNPNLSVPFSPFIANIISWQESNLNEVFPPATP